MTQGTDGSVAFTATQVTYTPDPEFFGTDSFTYTIEDTGGATDTATVTVTVNNVNDNPTALDDTVTVDEDSVNNAVDVLANDSCAPDVGETLDFTAITQGTDGTVAPSGLMLLYTPDPGFSGTDSFTYTIGDGNGGSATATVNVTVNPDSTSPGTIGNLSAAYAGVTDYITLTWTATGDDGAVGTADSYILKVSVNPITDDATFAAATTVAQTWTPQASGLAESHDIDLTWYTGTWHLAIKAVDSSGNESAVSNDLMVDTNPSASLPASAFDYGDVLFNNAATRTFNVSCTAASLVDLVITGIQITGDPAYAIAAGGYPGTDVVLAPGGVRSITVECLTTGPGPVSGTLEMTQNSTGAPAAYSVALTGNGVNEAPWIVSDNLSIDPARAGVDNPVLSVDVSDENNAFPALADVSTVTADLAAFGGTATDALGKVSDDGNKTATYQILVNTTGVMVGGYDIVVTATDAAGLTDTTTVTLTVYTGNVLNVPVDYTYIQDAIDAAADGDMVEVADGTYAGPGNVNLTFSGKAIVLVSANGRALTTIDCESASRGFTFADSGEDNSTVISGFTVTAGSAGAVMMTGNAGFASPTFVDCAFDSNTSATNGGAAHLEGGFCAPRFIDCTFINNYVDNATYSGGAIFGITGPQPTFRACTFFGNDAKYASAIHISGSLSVTIEDCVFDNNTAQTVQYGGAVQVENCNTTIDDCDFTNNNGRQGGAIYVDVGTLDVTSTFFSGNTALFGGCIYRWNSTSLTITDCTFTSNSASDAGAINASDATVQNSTFTSNTATGYGGAFVGRNANIVDCVFDGNSTPSRGGAVYCDGSVTGTTFHLNQSTNSDGGALASSGGGFSGSVALTGCTFRENTSKYRGGAFYGMGSATNCTFVDNQCERMGSAVYHISGGITDMTVTDCTFTGNQTTDATDGYGGTVCLVDGSTATVSGCVFDGNITASDGGAVLVKAFDATIKNCLITNNTASSEGGGICVAGGTLAKPTNVLNCTIADNLAALGGGVIFKSDVAIMTDTIVWANTDPGSSDQIYVDNAGAPTITISFSDVDVTGIVDTGFLINSPGGFVPGSNGNLSTDPSFVVGPKGDYYLDQAASPCVDAGSQTAAAALLDSRTTDPAGATDAGIVDTGWHYAP